MHMAYSYAYTLVETQDVLGIEYAMPLLLHVRSHTGQALLAAEEAVRDQLLDDRLLAHLLRVRVRVRVRVRARVRVRVRVRMREG